MGFWKFLFTRWYFYVLFVFFLLKDLEIFTAGYGLPSCLGALSGRFICASFIPIIVYLIKKSHEIIREKGNIRKNTKKIT